MTINTIYIANKAKMFEKSIVNMKKHTHGTFQKKNTCFWYVCQGNKQFLKRKCLWKVAYHP